MIDIWLRGVTLLAEHTIGNNLAWLVYWWTCCHLACRPINFHVWVLQLKIFHTISSLQNLLGIRSSSATLLCNKGVLSVCIMVITRAGANRAAAKSVSTSREKEKRHKSASRTHEWLKCQSAEERQSEIRQTDLMGHAEGRACLSEDRWSVIRQTNLMGYAEGHACLSEERLSEIRQTNRTGHAMSVREATKWNMADRSNWACRGMRMSVSGATKWNTEHQLDGACRGERSAHVYQMSEELHAENGAHHLNLLLLNHLSSNYHAARQIIERPCHLLSHAVHNSKLTTLPQSQRRWQPSWQRILEARRIIERLAKDQ